MGKIKNKTAKPQLRLVHGGSSFRFVIGAVEIVGAPENKPPFSTDAVAYEEDTLLVLSAPVWLKEPPEPILHLLAELRAMKPEEPGSVVVKGSSPVKLLAIVHDLNQEPSWREEWVVKALGAIFRKAEQRKLNSLALPFLGTRHGSLGKELFPVLLRSALEEIDMQYLNRIWLILPPGADPAILDVLKPEHPMQRRT